MSEDNIRPLEDSIVRDLHEKLDYSSYLSLDVLLHAQHPQSAPEHHDETLFIVQHQTTELWLLLIRHELDSVRSLLAADDLRLALKRVARVKHIQEVLTQQWSVLATLTPTEYGEFRGTLGNSSGLQSFQYRAVEFALGNRNAAMLEVFGSDPEAYAMLSAELATPSVYDEFLRLLSRRDLPVPPEVLERDVTQPYRECEALISVIAMIYNDPARYWDLYEACEDLVDLEDNFQFWRFRHLRTVTRTIGMKTGTGGSSGASFLQRALSLTFFPELYSVRTALGR